MSVLIKYINADKYSVNGKIVYKNSDGEWVCVVDELSTNEKKAFLNFIQKK